MRLLITSSTGPLHLADAQNTPVLIFVRFLPIRQCVGAIPAKRMVVSPDLKALDRCRMKIVLVAGVFNNYPSQIVEALEQRLKELN